VSLLVEGASEETSLMAAMVWWRRSCLVLGVRRMGCVAKEGGFLLRKEREGGNLMEGSRVSTALGLKG